MERGKVEGGRRERAWRGGGVWGMGVLVLVGVLAGRVFGQERPYALAERVDAKVRGEIKRQEVVGMAVVVIDGGKIAWSKGYGFEDREKQVAVDPAVTQFRWASICKSVTAIAALQLVEKGELDLDADVRKYVPEFPEKGVKITARELLCHQGGIPHTGTNGGKIVRTERTYVEPHPFADVVTALDMFKDSPLVDVPGTKYFYSTPGYVLLSAVVQRAGKERYADQVKERIAAPLGMADFRPDYQWEEIPHRAAGYMRVEGKVQRRTNEDDVTWKLGAGGYTSPAMDLARFGVGLLGGKLVSKATEREMWTVNKPKDPAGADPYGYGFFIVHMPDGRTLVGHDGSQQRAKTALLLDPEAKKGVALMTNSEYADAMKMAMMVMEEIK